MNTVITKSIPPGDFEEISIELPDWEAHLLKLVQEGKPIKYRRCNMPMIPRNIRAELSRRSYCNHILENDKEQHFLVPKSQ